MADRIGGPTLWSRAGWWDESLVGPSSRVRFALRWPIAGGLFLLPFVVPGVHQVLSDARPPAARVALVALIAVYAAGYLLYPALVFGNTIRTRVAFCVAMLALGWAIYVVFGVFAAGSVYALIYALVVAAFVLPPGWAFVLSGGSLAVLAVLLLVIGDFAADAGDFGTVTGVTVAMFFVGRLVRAVRQLRAAQDEIAALAVASERERVARDLHDLLGHSLTTITVKAGLARRLLQSQRPGQAADEIGEVEELSRTALADVRTTVSEYREVALPAELAGARAALRAADIEADLPHAVDNVRADLRQAFGYVLREAVTNVIRHSGASRVTVRLGRTWLEVADDGRGPGKSVPGNGLRGLTERLADVGGAVRTSVRQGGGFVLRAEV